MVSTVWISGASSGIGAAVARAIPDPDARVVSISRRPPAVGDHLAADLSDPAGWDAVRAAFEQTLARAGTERATFMHFAGEGHPHGHASEAPSDAYMHSVMLNAACGMVLGQAFLALCRKYETPATLVMCSSRVPSRCTAGMARYGAAKAALLHWTGVVRQEEPESVVLAVIPWAVDTPMLRDAVSQPVEDQPPERTLT